MSLDNSDPYHVYGGLQDNSSWVGDSSYPGGISNSRWENMYGGDGFWMFEDPSDPTYIYAEAQGPLTVGGIYLPNGNPIGTEKFAYKIAWMDRLRQRTKKLLESEEMFVLGGDYNVCPTDTDVFSPTAFANDALCQPQSRAALRSLLNLGLTDAIRAVNPDQPAYTYWDYQGGAYQKDNGLRIDHLLLSPQAADCLTTAGIDRGERAKVEPSDHVPVWCELDVGA